DYPRAVALGHIAEALDELLPEHEQNDDIFRLTLSVLRALEGGAIWMPLTYFDLWLARLTGLLPSLGECVGGGARLNGSPAFYPALSDGLMCAQDRRLASAEISQESRSIAAEMFRSPIERLVGPAWPRARAAELRKFLWQRIERLTEKRLVTAA